jgi:hypothetical protein
LRLSFAILNDDQIAEVNQQLFALASKGDGYLKCRRKGRPPLHVTIEFDRLIARFLWDTDVLQSAAVYEQRDPRAKPSLGAHAETFVVIQGLAPHPGERLLEVCSGVSANGVHGSGRVMWQH